MTRTSVELTDVFLRALEPPASGRLEVFDSKVTGLSVRVTTAGQKTFSLLLTIRGRRTRMTLGRFPILPLKEARQQALEHTRSLLRGEDPAAAQLKKKRTGLTVAALIDDFLALHVREKLRPTTATQYAYRLNAYVREEMGDHLAAEVTKRELIALGDSLAEDGKREKKAAGRGSKGGYRNGSNARLADAVIEIVSSMYNWAIKRDLLDTNPAYRVAKYSESARRDRVLADGEFPKLWSALTADNVGAVNALALKLMLATGQRRGEVIGARITELDLKSDVPTWTIHRDRTKNGLTHVVPLAPLAASLWREALATTANQHVVFAASRLEPVNHAHPGSITHAMRRLRQREGLPDLWAHDLRRTVRTRMAALRIPHEISARVLNHVDEFERGIHDEAYNRYDYLDEKRRALRLWELRLRGLIGGRKSRRLQW